MLNVTHNLMYICNLQPYYPVQLLDVEKSFYYILPPMSMFIKIRWFDLKSGESFQNAVIIDFFNSYEIRLVNNSNVGHF